MWAAAVMWYLAPILTFPLALLWLSCPYCDSLAQVAAPARNASNRFQLQSSLPRSCADYYDHCGASGNETAAASPAKKLVLPIRPEEMNSTLFKISRCFCDARCKEFGDCCLDMVADEVATIERQTANLTTLVRQETLGLSTKWECHDIPLKNFKDTDVYVVGSCPDQYPRTTIRKWCHRSIDKQQYNYMLDIPVVSKDSNLTYANIYCAMCHGDANVHRWSIHIYCPKGYAKCTDNITHWKYHPGERTWGFRHLNVAYLIELESVASDKALSYYESYGARKCRPDVVSACPGDWPSDRERRLCAAYAHYVKSPASRLTYKNEHCAACHRQPAAHFLCPYLFDKRLMVAAGSPPSYSMLIDFVGGDGKVGESRRCGQTGQICGYGQFCDPLNLVCRVYTCGRNYEMDDDGQCVAVDVANDTTTLVLDQLTLQVDCPKVYVHYDKFQRLPDNSIYVNATDRKYAVGEYEVVNQTTILVCIDPAILGFGKFSSSQAILSTVCVILSLVCLSAHIAVHALLPPLRKLPGLNLLCLSVSLATAQFLFEFGFQASSSFELCVSIAVLIHYGFLASFFWMNVMAIDVCRTFARKSCRPAGGQHRDLWKYSVYAWLTPFLIVLLAIFNDVFAFLPRFEPMYGEPICWINNRQALFLYFAAPLAVLLLENLVLFTLTVVGICHMSQAAKFARQNSSGGERTRFLLYAKLALIMGLTWVFGFVAAFVDVEALWYLFIIFNSLQGVFIFLAFSCKRKVWDLLRARFHCRRGDGVDAGSDSGNATSSEAKGKSLRGTILTTLTCPPTPALTGTTKRNLPPFFFQAGNANLAKRPATVTKEKGP